MFVTEYYMNEMIDVVMATESAYEQPEPLMWVL